MGFFLKKNNNKLVKLFTPYKTILKTEKTHTLVMKYKKLATHEHK